MLNLFGAVLAAAFGSAHAGEDATCKLVFDALERGVMAPNHSYLKMKMDFLNGGKPADSEIINTGNARYVKTAGDKWKASLSTQDLRAQLAENRKNNQSTCRFIRDETIDGVPASLYETKEDTDMDSKVWISKASGLPVHTVSDGNGTHSETRFVYGPVNTPIH